MDKKVLFVLPGAVLSVLVGIFTLLGAYYFSLSGISLKMFLTINTFPLINAVLTLNFLIFLICAALSISMMLVIGRRYPLTGALLLTMIPYFAGAAIGAFIFGLNDFFIPIIASVAGIPVGIRFLAEKEDELRYLKRPRAGGSAAGRIITIASLIFALFLLFHTLPQKETLQEEFIPELLLMTIGDENLSMGDSFRMQLAGAISEQQVSTIDTMLRTPALRNLSEKNDPDAQNLISSLEATKTNFRGEEFKKDVADKLESQNLDIGKELLGKFPMIALVARFAWLLYPFTALVTLMFIGGLVTRNLAAGFYGLIGSYIRPEEENMRTYATTEEEKAQTEQNNNK